MEPTVIGRYQVERRLGRGGMGSLYLARDPDLDRLVAIKVLKEDLRDDVDLRERFAREARSAARLRHPNIVVVYDVGTDGAGPFIAMEYIEGDTLGDVLRREPPPLAERLAFVEGLCAGLAHAHAAGIIHRDIKPANIMIDGGGVAKILDFGIARPTQSNLTMDGMMIGTVNYMSPEQVMGSVVDHRTDIFAAGAVLYEAVALVQAFPERIDTGVLHKIMNAGPTPIETVVPDVDLELARIVAQALDRDPARRYPAATDMRLDIRRVRTRLQESSGEFGATVMSPGRRVETPRVSTGVGTAAADGRRRRIDPERLALIRQEQVEEHLRTGREAFAAGDYDLATRQAERAVTVDPDNHAAFDLLDEARLAMATAQVREILAEAKVLLQQSRFDEVEARTARAFGTIPDLQEAAPLRAEVQRVADALAAARERERKIDTSVEQAKAALDRGGVETALRAVYEALALDPDRQEVRELEQVALSRLEAKRQHEEARRGAYDRIASVESLARAGAFDQARRVLGEVAPPSDTVRLAAAEALTLVDQLERRAGHEQILAAAQSALVEGHLERAIETLEGIPGVDRTTEWRAIRNRVDAAVAAEEQRRHVEEEQHRREAEDARAGATVVSARQQSAAAAAMPPAATPDVTVLLPRDPQAAGAETTPANQAMPAEAEATVLRPAASRAVADAAVNAESSAAAPASSLPVPVLGAAAVFVLAVAIATWSVLSGAADQAPTKDGATQEVGGTAASSQPQSEPQWPLRPDVEPGSAAAASSEGSVPAAGAADTEPQFRAATGAVTVAIDPSPVPFSGQPITDAASCSGSPNTWFYDQTLRETGGVDVTVTQRVDAFDGAVTSRSNPYLRIPANGSATLRTRWCSSSPAAHTAQSNFSGTDANGRSWSAIAETVPLLAR